LVIPANEEAVMTRHAFLQTRDIGQERGAL
jgi:hypothetical protein